MSIQVKIRRDTAANISVFTPASGELIVDQTNNRVLVGDGTTVGGFAAAKLSEAMSLQMGANAIKGNNTGGVANAADLTVPQVHAMIHSLGMALAVRNLDLNATGDTAITVSLPTGVSNYNVSAIRLTNSQTNEPSATARVGVYSATSQGGTALVAQQAINALTLFSPGVSTNVLSLTLALGAPTALNYATLYVNVGTANGAAATADVIIDINFY